MSPFISPLKLPSFHLHSETQKFYGHVFLYSKEDVEAVNIFSVNIGTGITPQFLDNTAQSLVDIITIRGYESMALRRFGPQWSDRIIEAVFIEHMAAIKYVHRVEVDRTLRWTDASEHFAGFSHTLGSSLLLEIMSTTSKSYEIRGSQTYLSYKPVEQNYEELRHHVSNRISQAVFDQYDRQDFLIPQIQGVLRALKNEKDFPDLKDFYFKPWDFVPNRDPICIADLLIDDEPGSKPVSATEFKDPGLPTIRKPNEIVIGFDASTARAYEPDINVRLIHNEGMNLYSQALGQIFQFRLINDVIYRGTVIKDTLYFKWTGKPVAALREIRTEIWFGIKYLQPGGVNPNTGEPNSPPPSRGPGGGGSLGRSNGRSNGYRGGRPSQGGSQPRGPQPTQPSNPTSQPGGVAGQISTEIGNIAASIAHNAPPTVGQAIGTRIAQAILPPQLQIPALVGLGLLVAQQSSRPQIQEVTGSQNQVFVPSLQNEPYVNNSPLTQS